MRDYRLSEIRDICKKQRPVDKKINCFHCPIYKICIKIEEQVPYEWEMDFECTKEDCPYYNDGKVLSLGNCLRPKDVECPKNIELPLAEYGSATTTSASTSDEQLVVEANTPDEFIIYTPFIV